MTEAVKSEQSRAIRYFTGTHLLMTMPSAHYLNLFLVAVLSICSLGNQTPLHSRNPDSEETSGELQQDLTDAVDHGKWNLIASLLQQDIAILRDEQFKRDFGQTEFKMKDFSMSMPLLNSSDGCLSKNFKAQRCLRKIYTGLSIYKEYLPYVERQNLTTALMNNINLATTRLLHIIKEKVNDGQVPQHFSSVLPEDSAWRQKTVTHSILFHYATFMNATVRAISYMKKTQQEKAFQKAQKSTIF
ncbi:interleukin-6 [Trichomycterus rosablanca]|uniref:interleukin-6 n=1 Tax=Trichomycterus rosablanca TaxID=2290929 RepID=UPI002F357213